MAWTIAQTQSLRLLHVKYQCSEILSGEILGYNHTERRKHNCFRQSLIFWKCLFSKHLPYLKLRNLNLKAQAYDLLKSVFQGTVIWPHCLPLVGNRCFQISLIHLHHQLVFCEEDCMAINFATCIKMVRASGISQVRSQWLPKSAHTLLRFPLSETLRSRQSS